MSPRRAATAGSLRAVCAGIASSVLGSAHTLTVGDFALRPLQQRTLGALRAAIAEFGGALLADPPGTGKTVLALAAAQGAGSVLVLAPSALRAQWHTASARAQVPVAFVSLEALSRGAVRAAAEFVIIDEAHHLRTTSARRYARAASACVGADVLLLTATPVVNRAADREALLALFMGSRAEHLSGEELGRVVVRRHEASGSRPTLRRRGAIVAHSEIDGIANALRQLPPPVPVTVGPPATALIVMTLAMAWQSSLAAFDAALRRRQQRGGAFRDLLLAGRVPSSAALRHWTLHDDATQLALPLLVAPGADSPAPAEAMLESVDRHLAAIAALRQLIGPHRAVDSARRASAVRALLTEYPDRRIVAFARHAETIRALHAALRGEPGVVAIIGSRVRAASGRWSRDEVLRAIGPRARPYDPSDPRAIRLVLSTDALAEGVEMQGVGVVVHADLPWTPARLEQRVGRVVRTGSVIREIVEAWFSAPEGARALVKLGARLAHKSRTRRRSVRDAEARGGINEVLERWAQAAAACGADRNVGDANGSARGLTAVTSAACDGFVSATEDDGGVRLICGVHDGVRWRVSSAPRRVLSVLRSLDDCGAALRAADPGTVASNRPHAVTPERVRRLLARVLVRRGALELAGGGDDRPTRSRSERRLARVRQRFGRLLERAPALARPALAERQRHLMRVLALPLESARERRIDDLLRADHDVATFARRLGALLQDRMDRSSAGDPAGPARHAARSAPLLLLRSASAPSGAPAAVPPSASTGSAATR